MAIYKNVIDGPNDPNRAGTVIHCIYFKALALDQLFAFAGLQRNNQAKTTKAPHA